VSRYAATVTREGRWWAVRVPDLDRMTLTRRLVDAEPEARELIAEALGRDVPFTVVVVVAPLGGLDIAAELATIRRAREDAAELDRRALELSAALAKSLQAEGLTVRDIGTLVGLSFQRVHQLLRS
jgi:hypothetical protein